MQGPIPQLTCLSPTGILTEYGCGEDRGPSDSTDSETSDFSKALMPRSPLLCFLRRIGHKERDFDFLRERGVFGKRGSLECGK